MTAPKQLRPVDPVEPARRLRLLSVTVQARFILDDGDDVTEVTGPTMTVVGRDWRTFADGSFTDDDLTQILAAFDNQQTSK